MLSCREQEEKVVGPAFEQRYVWVVDDDPIVLEAVARLLRSGGYEVRTFSSGELFLAQADCNAPGCIVLDLCMPGLGGLELQEALSRVPHPAALVFMTAQGDVASSVRAMKAGAVDFLLKPFDGAKLFAAVETALQRSRALRLARAERERVAKCYARLTPREKEVLEHLLLGRRNKQIAADLGAAEKTIKVHRARLQLKMEVRSLAELAGSIERVGLRGDLQRRVL
jgi:FixJ family two-component response regulator